MAKNLKINIKNTQLAKAVGLDSKPKTSEKKQEEATKAKATEKVTEKIVETEEQKPARKIRAKSKSAFALQEEAISPATEPAHTETVSEEEVVIEEVREAAEEISSVSPPPLPEAHPQPARPPVETPPPRSTQETYQKLGPTGRHIKDLYPPPAKREAPKVVEPKVEEKKTEEKKWPEGPLKQDSASNTDLSQDKKGKKIREFKDLKPTKRQQVKTFDARDRQGLTEGEDERWRKRRAIKQQRDTEEQVVRPTLLKIRLPISIKDLASEMKLKSSELIQKLFLHGMTYTLNDLLDDETVVQYVGNEFGCAITIDTSEEERLQVTSQTVRDEISTTNTDSLILRPPIVAFMGHVDHGKTSLIDAIRKTNLAAGEAGAITQHIGAFRCKTAVGDITILDTPGHEAFSAMRARGAVVTDIVVLVIAGDEGMREQTKEAIQHAKQAGVTIVVAINKCDKSGFNAENVFRQLSEIELLPEAWGGQTITVNTSAVTKEGISQLLEMLALQAEVLELRANPQARARGVVLESELHKGLGSLARVLVQNGTLRLGDALVFERHWGRIKTMHDEHGALIKEAGPSTPIEVTGLSGVPAAGDPFVVVKNEKEARNIIETRQAGREQRALAQKKTSSLESMMQKGISERKTLKLVLRADVQGSVEALKTSLSKIESKKVIVDIIAAGVGEVSESDIQLAAASNAAIIGFHTAIESHAASLIKEFGVKVALFDIIYHAVDAVKEWMLALLDRIEQEKDVGVAQVKATFKASQLGVIAGCIVTDGLITRNHRIRVVREGAVIWKGGISSLKRVKEDVKEVKKGFECGIVLDGFRDVKEDDILQSYEIIYLTQEL